MSEDLQNRKKPVLKQQNLQVLGHSLPQYRILIQILACCIDQVRQNRSFQYIDRTQQKFILEIVWFECFLLRAAYWTINILPIVNSFDDPFLASKIAKIQDLQVDLTELNFLETLTLCKREHGITQETIKQLGAINENALLALGRYIIQRGHQWPRFGRLLLALRSLGDGAPNNNSMIYVVFKDIIGQILSSPS